MKDHEYELSFYAKGSVTGLSIGVQDGRASSPFTNYLNTKDTLTDAWKKYTYTFTAQEDLSLDARIKFQLHNQGSYFFDDVILKDITNQQPTSVESSQASIVNVYPNPAINIVTVNNSLNGPMTLVLYNNKAIAVRKRSVNGNESTTIDVSDLASGVYFLIAQSGLNKTIRKIILE